MSSSDLCKTTAINVLNKYENEVDDLTRPPFDFMALWPGSICWWRGVWVPPAGYLLTASNLSQIERFDKSLFLWSLLSNLVDHRHKLVD